MDWKGCERKRPCFIWDTVWESACARQKNHKPRSWLSMSNRHKKPICWVRILETTINVVNRSQSPKFRRFSSTVEIIVKLISWLREMYKSPWVIGKHTLHGKGRRSVVVRTPYLGCFAVWCFKRIDKDHRLFRVRSARLTVIKTALSDVEPKVKSTCFGTSNKKDNARNSKMR
jgi:hypothetical protein